MLEVTDLVKTFAVKSLEGVKAVEVDRAGRVRRVVQRGGRTDARAGGGVQLRQVDGRALSCCA